MSMYDDGEGILDEMAEEHFRNAWCPKCQTHAEDCVCENEPKECVHNPGSDNAQPVEESPWRPEPGSPSRMDGVGNYCVPKILGGGEKLSSTTADLRLDQTESAAKWFDEERGAESNPYTNEEAEARRKEWQNE